ncbi:MAG: 3-deoxy-8-phosphooctulonate synthase [Elusimicrobiota bacterium]
MGKQLLARGVLTVGNVRLGNHLPAVAIGGPCGIESEHMTLSIAKELKRIFKRLGIGFIFKASFDKANRSSIGSWRGLGIDEGLRILRKVKDTLGLPILTDIHEPAQAVVVSGVADILQIPAFLCRQTDLIVAAARTGKVVNVKKGQFMSPWECGNAVDKVLAAGNPNVALTERGFTFGYNNLVVDMRSLEHMKTYDCPVIFDSTHSQQLPGGKGHKTGGMPQFISAVARAATAVGVAGIFFETHPKPAQAKSDGSNSLKLDAVEDFWKALAAIDKTVKKLPKSVLGAGGMNGR